MKEISEYTAEVFRRSEERIKERRKKHRRILAVCIPFCLMTTVCFTAIIPQMMTKNNDVQTDCAGTSPNDGSIAYGTACDFVLIDIKGAGANEKYQSSITDTAEISSALEQINEILPYNAYSGAEKSADGNVTEGVPKSEPTGYIITLTADDGTTRIFTLRDNCLYDAKMRVEITLSDKQTADLKSSLKLTE